MESYLDKRRFYHNFKHIKRMWEIIEQNKIPISDRLNIAIMFHDVIYNPNLPYRESEIRSANLAKKMIRNSMLNLKEDEVGKLIESTIDHNPLTCELEEESQIIIDLDLWDLSDLDKYKKNGILIEKEWLAFKPDKTKEDFKEGRKKWLKYMLNKEKIYHSKYATEEMEKQARQNIKNELDTIG